MTFALIFIIVLCIILIIGSILIWKSNLPINDRIGAIISILVLFSIVSIVNELRRSSYEDTTLTVAEFERYFYVPAELELNRVYRLPILDDFKSIVIDSLQGWNAENPTSYEFALVYSNKKVGKTLAFKEYAKYLQGIKVPTLYIQIKRANTDVFHFAGELKIPDLTVLEDTIQRFNKEGKTPNIFIDSIENGFSLDATMETGFPCSICDYMRTLYDRNRMNIFLITNSYAVKDMLETNEEFNKVMSFYHFNLRNNPMIINYLKDKINIGIKPEGKRFDSSSAALFLQTLGLDYSMINEYVYSINNYEGVQHFIDSTVEKETERILAFSELDPLLGSIVSITEGNEWIPYNNIRTLFEESPLKSLEEAVRTNILIKSHSMYRFKDDITYKAILHVFKTKAIQSAETGSLEERTKDKEPEDV